MNETNPYKRNSMREARDPLHVTSCGIRSCRHLEGLEEVTAVWSLVCTMAPGLQTWSVAAMQEKALGTEKDKSPEQC